MQSGGNNMFIILWEAFPTGAKQVMALFSVISVQSGVGKSCFDQMTGPGDIWIQDSKPNTVDPWNMHGGNAWSPSGQKYRTNPRKNLALKLPHTPVICCCTLLAFQNFCTLSFLPLAKVKSTRPKSSKLLRRRKRRTAPFSFAALSLGIWAMTTPRERSLKKWANNERVQTGCCKSLPRHSS